MHKDLDNWLNDVWKERKKLIRESKKQGYIRGRGASAGMESNEGVGLIYDMYNATSSEGGSMLETDLNQMKRMLVQLESDITVAPTVQLGSDMARKDRGWLAGAKLDELENRFFHYSPDRGAGTGHRIYINCKTDCRGDVFKSIFVDYGAWGVRGLSSAKVSSHGNGRVDTIVIYCESERSSNEALDCIQRYHQTAKRNFLAALPKLITPARELTGVGTAMEPPSVQIVSTGGKFYQKSVGQSFGAYRSEMIFMALERTRFSVDDQSEEQRKQAFKRRVEKYFRQAGIDPDKPALQGEVKSLPDLSSIKDWINRQEI